MRRYLAFFSATLYRLFDEAEAEAVAGETVDTETVNTEMDGTEMEMPEEIQSAGHTVERLENLPTYQYEQQEIEVYNNGQRIYGIA